jgi:RNA-directed DNA polymerase
MDRCHQARVRNALEPEWEARFEPKSYGFRPGRGCHDAIVAIHTTASRTDATRRWVLDADLAAAFDHLNHDHICTSLGTFPAAGLVRQWLEAGVIEDGGFLATEEGAPQGGLCAAAHNPPYEQCWVMRSVGLSCLVRGRLWSVRCA